MPDFVTLAKTHLAAYKTSILGIAEHGLSSRNNQPYPHIIPAQHRDKNLLPAVYSAFEAFRATTNCKLHRDFHHLTSSQALAFNLFLPVVASWSGISGQYARLLGLRPRTIRSLTLEAIPDLAEGTNFDALAHLDEGSRAYIEVKFTESGFGQGRNDEAHQAKLREIYLPRLAGRVEESCLEPTHFFRHYQLYRNLSAIRPETSDVLVLLLPRSHAGVWEHAMIWSTNPRLRDLRAAIRLIALEDVLDGLAASAVPASTLDGHVRHLHLKYRIAAAERPQEAERQAAT
jgi:hypothetical protein